MRGQLPLLLRGVIALALASAIWWYSRPAYEPALTSIANAILERTETSSITRLTYSNHLLQIFRGGLPRQNGGTLNVSYITLNMIVLLTLVGMSVKPDRKSAWQSTAACALLFLVHIVALYVSTKAIIMLSEVALGRREVGLIENVWFAAYQGYSVVGGHAIAFAIWWLIFRPPLFRG